MSKKGFSQLREECYFKAGRPGAVFEAIDMLEPNLLDDNKNIGAEIFKKSSKFRFTLVDARGGKGRAAYYNLDPDEVLLLTYLLSDGMPLGFKNRVGAYNDLSGKEQIQLRKIVETFDSIDIGRFDRMLDYSKNKKGTAIHLQKNIHIGNNELLVRKMIISFEEKMTSDSKWKITIEVGNAVRNPSGGLNIVKYGTYKETEKIYLMLQGDEIVTPINEAAKRVIMSQNMYYWEMKRHLKEFTKRKMENEDPNGERIDVWNPEGKSKFPSTPKPKTKPRSNTNNQNRQSNQKIENKEEVKKEETKEGIKDRECSDCKAAIDKNVYDYSLRVMKKPLCIPCQRK